ncbi:MAG TPA: hypothetical protein ENG80_04780 [Nitrospirae bacterium]|nr:hypothetical protein [Nitrospirota bacterium]HDH51232.1 hypothetical protein [Nitrospirota bacterium]HDK81014.1 hypothetical protein [Nitrospirota bacterium]
MSKERLALKGRLIDKKKDYREAVRRADSLIITIRDIIDPYEEDFTDLDLARSQVAMNDLCKLKKEARDLKEQIDRMERDLNG